MTHKLLASLICGLMISISTASTLAQNVAIVNGVPVPLSRFAELKQQVERSGREVTSEVSAQIKAEVIARAIFIQEAEKQRIDTTEGFKTQIELAKQTMLIRDLFTKYQRENPVTESDIRAEYKNLKASSVDKKEYRVSHILVDKLAEAKSIIYVLKRNAERFEEIARRSSKDPASGANGGALDWELLIRPNKV